MVGLQVEFYWYQIGAASFLHAFFSTVCFRLEQGNWGSKFPRLMNDLYHGRLKSEYVKDALVELKCSPKVGQKLCGKAILNSVLDRT